jgi:hypothetical protein
VDKVTIIILIIGILGLLTAYIFRNNVKKGDKFLIKKIKFSLLNYLYINESELKKFSADFSNLDNELKMKIILSELKKTKNDITTQNKLLILLNNFNLLEYELQMFRKGNEEQKIKIINDLSYINSDNITKIFTEILDRDESEEIKLETISALLEQNEIKLIPKIIQTCIKFKRYNYQKLIEILYKLSCKYPDMTIDQTISIDNISLKEVINFFLTFLFSEDTKAALVGAFFLGYFQTTNTSKFLVDKLNSQYNKNLNLVILKTLKKIGDVTTSNDIYNFILKINNNDTGLIQEGLQTLKSLGHNGEKYIRQLLSSDNAVTSIMAKSYL